MPSVCASFGTLGLGLFDNAYRSLIFVETSTHYSHLTSTITRSNTVCKLDLLLVTTNLRMFQINSPLKIIVVSSYSPECRKFFPSTGYTDFCLP
ncbi:hypothetical protein CW304_03140 [Bacillus sp. UFRGS-B20]|nr:hypothetical protein CW304_03140 [Bacillus sp. UFRGS-B20]